MDKKSCTDCYETDLMKCAACARNSKGVEIDPVKKDMTDIKEKMVELMAEAKRSMWGKNGLSCELARNIYLADRLIANGVAILESNLKVFESSESGWISVEERLPEEDKPVIICTKENFIYAGMLIGDIWFLDNDCWTEQVTHWMPLPEPPKGDAEK